MSKISRRLELNCRTFDEFPQLSPPDVVISHRSIKEERLPFTRAK